MIGYDVAEYSTILLGKRHWLHSFTKFIYFYLKNSQFHIQYNKGTREQADAI